MAHAATINELSGKLVTSITGRSSDKNELRQSVTETSTALKGSGHARTNQFEIRSKLDGLVEKFAVLNRDDLSDELRTRLDELPTESKWLPEVLSLLLSLSDRPLEKTRLEDVESLVEDLEDVDNLDWKEILADRSADEPGLWDDVDRGYDSSDDESSMNDENVTTSTNATSVHEEDLTALARLYVTQPDDTSLQSIKDFRERLEHENDNEKRISGLYVIRNSLSMLQGLPTELYNLDQSTGLVTAESRFALSTSTRQILNEMLDHLADTGSRLNHLRTWLRAQTRLLYLQSCKAAIRRSVRHFQSAVAAIETTYTSPRKDLVVSITDVESEVERLAKPVLLVSKIVRKAEEELSASAFVLLDLLYEEICITQMSDDRHATDTLIEIFTAGLRTYLKPTSSWIRMGNLNDADGSFFVVEKDADCGLADIWHGRFALRRLQNGEPSAPVFLGDMVGRIFALGKSRAVLNTLAPNTEQDVIGTDVSLPDFQWLSDQAQPCSLMPFSQVLSDLLHSWIAGISKDCTPALCKTLLHDHGLLRSLDGMAVAFCSRNGRLFQMFADTLFWRMDAGKSWRDSFLLTELAQSTLGSVADINADALSIRIENERTKPSHSSVGQLEAIKLEMLFTWPLQNITRSRSPTSYLDAFTFVLQIYRAKYLLRRHFDVIRGLGKSREHVDSIIAAALRLRQSFTTILEILHNHVTSALLVLSTAVRSEMERADGIDAMERIWAEHEKQMRLSLLLTSNLKPLKEAVLNVLQLCERFCDYWNVSSPGIASTIEDGDHERDDNQISSTRLEVSQRPTRRALKDFGTELEKSLSFISAGVRATSRAAGSTALEALSDRLQWFLSSGAQRTH